MTEITVSPDEDIKILERALEKVEARKKMLQQELRLLKARRNGHERTN